MTFPVQQAAAWSEIRETFSPNETPNGPGSTMAATSVVRQWLPKVIAEYGITSILDIPCGDWNWMQHVNLHGVEYTGWDIEEDFIARNRERWPEHTFEKVNILRTRKLPAVDLILCRDFLIHLPNDYADKVIDKFVNSGSRYLLSTVHPGADNTIRTSESGYHDNRPGYFCWDIDLNEKPFCLDGAQVAAEAESERQWLYLFDLSRA